jgi:hypothetical protein
MSSRVRDLAQKIVSRAQYLELDCARAEAVAQAFDGDVELPRWDFAPFYPQSDDFEEMCKFYLIFNAINYCYFDAHRVRFSDGNMRGSTLTGLRLTEHWKDIQNPQFLANVDENYLLGELFDAHRPISLVKERTAALREVGVFLNTNPDFTFHKLFTKHRNNAYHVSQIIPTLLPSWRDPFFKRAQLFVGMAYGRFRDREDLPIDSESLFDLTVFADYRVPQTLINLGLIKLGAMVLHENYSGGDFIESGSLKELEIRAATIIASDILMEEINKRREEPINPLHMDYILWSAARKRDDYGDLFVKNLNHHYTLTTDY